MTTHIVPLTKRMAWKALEAHCKKVQPLHLRTFFAEQIAPDMLGKLLPTNRCQEHGAVWLGIFNVDVRLVAVDEQAKRERVSYAVHELLKTVPLK
jgi:hypothetical protein